jgi:hypothetical protein
MGFTASDGEWGRRLSVHLDGFSKDGKHIFGVISEGGKYSFVQVFDFRRDGSHSEIQVKNGLARLRAVNCGTSFAIAGTNGNGELVLEPNTENRCRADHRWTLDKEGNLRDLKKDEAVVSLYDPQVPSTRSASLIKPLLFHCAKTVSEPDPFHPMDLLVERKQIPRIVVTIRIPESR